MSYPQSVVKNIYRDVPEIIAELIASEEILREIVAISQQHHLNPDQGNLLGNEITMRLIGITPKDSFINNLKNELKISGEIAEQIALIVESRIVSKIPADILIKQESTAQTKVRGVTETNKTESVLVSVPEIPPVNLPMIEPGEVAREVLPVEESSKFKNSERISPPDYRYPEGKDPYREPLA